MSPNLVLLTIASVLVAGIFTLLHAQIPSASPAPQLVQAPARDTLDIILIVVQILTFLINAAALCGLFLYVRRTSDIATATVKALEVSQRATEISQSILAEMRVARDEESAPYVVAYFDVQMESDIMNLVIKNVGKSVARNINLEFQPPLVNSDEESVSDKPLIKNGISSLPPGHEIKVLFDTPLYYFGEQADGSKFPLNYDVKVTFTGGMRPDSRTLHQSLDLSPYLGFSFFRRKGMDELVKALEKLVDSGGNVLTKKLDDLVEALKGGLWLKNAELFGSGHPLMADDWPRIAQAKLNEFKFLWTSIYGGDVNKLVNPFLNNLKVSILILSYQILKIASNAPVSVSGEITNELLQIASRLNELSSQRIYIGKESRTTMDSLGTEIVKLIDGVFEKLSNVVDAETVGQEFDATDPKEEHSDAS